MSRTPRRLSRTAALGLFAAASVAALPDAIGAAMADRLALNPLSEIGVDGLTGFRDRPLFTPSRRPPPPPPEVVVEPEPEPEPVAEVEPEPEIPADPPQVQLSGIVEIDQVAVAVLRDDAEETTMSVRVGDGVEDWTVAAIGDASITLELDGRRHEIKIFEPGGESGGRTAALPPQGRVPVLLRRDDDMAPDGRPPNADRGGRVREQIPQRVLDQGGIPDDQPIEVLDEEDPFADEDLDVTYEGDDPELWDDEEDLPIDAAEDDDFLYDAADEEDPWAEEEDEDPAAGDTAAHDAN